MSDETHKYGQAPSEHPRIRTNGNYYATYVAYKAPADRLMTAEEQAGAAAEVEELLTGFDAQVRGWYSLGAFRAEADILLWIIGPTAESVQEAVLAIRHTTFGRSLEEWWTATGVHRDAEFNRSHIPAYLRGTEPKGNICLYPFVRTHEWYLIDDKQRRTMLAEHGRMGAEHTGVLANTISAFGLGDYEWLLTFEADDMTEFVDLLRHLRNTEARLYTKHELPFFTGIRKPLAAIVDELPAARAAVREPAGV
jgi:chlorite dismutase